MIMRSKKSETKSVLQKCNYVLIQFFGFFFFVKLIQNSIMCKKISSKSKVKRRSRVVTFIPNNEVEAVERPTFWDLRRNYSLETFDCWSSHQCPKCCQRCHHSNNNNNHNAPTNQSWSDHHQTKACFLEASANPAYHHQHHHHQEALPKRPSLRPSRKVLEILPG